MSHVVTRTEGKEMKRFFTIVSVIIAGFFMLACAGISPELTKIFEPDKKRISQNKKRHRKSKPPQPQLTPEKLEQKRQKEVVDNILERRKKVSFKAKPTYEEFKELFLELEKEKIDLDPRAHSRLSVDVVRAAKKEGLITFKLIKTKRDGYKHCAPNMSFNMAHNLLNKYGPKMPKFECAHFTQTIEVENNTDLPLVVAVDYAAIIQPSTKVRIKKSYKTTCIHDGNFKARKTGDRYTLRLPCKEQKLQALYVNITFQKDIDEFFTLKEAEDIKWAKQFIKRHKYTHLKMLMEWKIIDWRKAREKVERK